MAEGKVHVSKDGKVRPCKATKRACSLQHFDSMEQAHAALEKQSAQNLAASLSVRKKKRHAKLVSCVATSDALLDKNRPSFYLEGVLEQNPKFSEAELKQLGFFAPQENEVSNEEFVAAIEDSKACISNLGAAQRQALQQYTNYDYYAINSVSLGMVDQRAEVLFPTGPEDSSSDSVAPDDLETATSQLDSCFDNTPKYNKVVYRGVPSGVLRSVLGLEESASDSEVIDKLSNGDNDIVFDAHTSTSYSFHTASRFGDDGHTRLYPDNPRRVIFEFNTPEGVSLSRESRFEEEQEVLLPRGTRYRCVGVKTETMEIKQRELSFLRVAMIPITSRGEVIKPDCSNKEAPADLSESLKKYRARFEEAYGWS